MKELFKPAVYEDKSGSKPVLRVKQRPAFQETAVKYYNQRHKPVTAEDVEDATMDVILLAMQRGEVLGKDVTESVLMGRIRQRTTKLMYKNTGLNQDGSMPKDGRKMNIKNNYDSKTGENLIYKAPDTSDNPAQITINDDCEALLANRKYIIRKQRALSSV